MRRTEPIGSQSVRIVIDAAMSQIGVTTIYDPAYVRIGYPGGDVPSDRGVCTDVVTVSYTHLDVYKRQAFTLPGLMSSTSSIC